MSFGTANDPSAANAGGTLYAIGGCTSSQSASVCTTTTAATYAEISSEGDVGPAENTTELPLAAGWFASAVVVNNGYIYNIGGCRIVNNVNGCTTTTNTIYYAQLNANGTVGTWNPTTTTLPANRAAAGAAVLGNVLYVAGGTTGTTASTNVYSAVLASNGNITTAFNTSTTGLAAAALYPFTFAYVNPSAPTTGYLTTVGGCTQSTADGIGCNGYVSTVRRCPVATVGTVGLGTCVGTTGTPGGILQLPNETGIAAGAVHGSYVYLASGANPDVSGTAGAWGGQTNLTYYAKIDNSGNLVVPPGKSGTTWALITAKLANNGVTDTGTNNAPGQRRRASAYAVNGYLYVLGGHDGNSTSSANGQTLQDVEIGKIDPSTGDIASFVDNYYQIAPRWDFKGAAANGFIYAVGGCTGGFPPAGCTAADRSVQYMQIYNNYSGTPASYNAAAGTSAILNPMYGGSSAISNGYIYVAGGTTSPGSIPNNDVQYAPIASDGTIGAWTAVPGSSSGTLDIRRMFFKLVAANGYLYALGGQSGTGNNSSLATVEKSLLDPLTGVPGRFNVEAATGFTARSGLDAVFYNGYLYVTGGMGTTGSTVNTVAYSQVNPTTGTLSNWTNSANTFTTARMFHSAVAYNGTLYVLGGYTGSAYLSDVQYAQINSNGSIGTFNTTQNLPQPVSQGTAYAANGYLYVLAGRSGATTTSCTNNTYVASLSANSTVANGNVPNGLGGWTQTAVTYAGPRYGATTSYSAGKVYLFGGSQCATSVVVAAGTTTYYGTLQSQPQVASYSYAIDALYDVFPSKSLFNGIDNGIGANWRLSYRSSTNAAKVWGRNTDYGKTTLGVPQTYIPLDGSGASTSFARYYWIKLSIDGSQAFGYPEDVSRGPTIANLTLQFTANPSQRLRNGKTFINNVEQPLDAPF